MINSYTYMRGPLEVGVTVTANTCVPVGEVVNGQTANGTNVFFFYFLHAYVILFKIIIIVSKQ